MQYLGIIPVGRLHLHTWTLDHPFKSLKAGSDIVGIPCQRAHVLRPNDSDLTGFQKPTSISFQRFLCRAQTIRSRRQSNVQIKACYPLLRGRLHIMMEGLDFISVCERITHCCGGRKFISPPFFYFLPRCISYKICSDRRQRTWPAPQQISGFHTCGRLRRCNF